MNADGLFVVRAAENIGIRMILAFIMSLLIHSILLTFSKDFKQGISESFAEAKRITLTFGSTKLAPLSGSNFDNQAMFAVINSSIKRSVSSLEKKPIETIKPLKKLVLEQHPYVIYQLNNRPKLVNNKHSMSLATLVEKVTLKQFKQINSAVSKIETDTESTRNETNAANLTRKQTLKKKLAVRLKPKFSSPPQPPYYPRHSIRRNQQGTALIRAKISRFGKVEELIVHQSSKYEALDLAAIAAVRKWQFEPAKSNGFSIASWVQVPVNFVLN